MLRVENAPSFNVGTASECYTEDDNKLQVLEEKLVSVGLTGQSVVSSDRDYTEWNTDVDLGSPDPGNPLTKHDSSIYEEYNYLQYALYENNLPETVDRTQQPRTKNSDTGVCIVFLSSPLECMAALLEGGRQCPGDMLLVLSPTWISKEKSEKVEGLHSLYVKKAITFDRGGSTYIDVFQTPRRCTYFVNFLTGPVTDGLRNDGESLEIDLDCPMSSSAELSKRVDDKLLTRLWMAKAGLLYPETLALTYKPAYEYNIPDDASIRIINIEQRDVEKDVYFDELKQFLESETIKEAKKVVVKPSGSPWYGSKGVTIHDVIDVYGISNAMTQLLDVIEEEDSILVEAFHGPPAIQKEDIDKHTFRLRAILCRQADNQPITTQISCGIGKNNQPIHGDNSIPISLETTLQMWGLEEKERARLVNTIKTGSEKLMECVINDEKSLSSDLRGGPGAQTDMIGIDYVISEVNGQMEPVGIEVNSHDCTYFIQLFENFNPHRRGEAVKPWVETMIKRSQMFALRAKTVLMIGAGGFSKRFIFDAYQEFGIKIVLVDNDNECYAASRVDRFVQYDFNDHKQDKQHALDIIKIIHEEGIEVDGCITFWEDCGPLAATICARLGLRGPGEKAASIAKNKGSTQKTIMGKTGMLPHFPRTYHYAGKSRHVETEEEIDSALEFVGLPAVMKLEFGSSAVGVKPVHDRVHCKNMFVKLKTSLTAEEDHPGVGLGHGNDIMLMELLTGSEHDVDIVIFNRQLIAAFISDNGPTRPGSFTETSACMPTCLPIDRQGQLITAAYQCCVGVGLVDGVFNVEMKMSPYGPKLIEINARMGGFYLRNWILACYGVDLLLTAFMCCLGVRPIIPKPEAKGQLMGVMCLASLHKDLFHDNVRLNLLHNLIRTGVVRFNQIEESIDHCGDNGEEEPFCSIGVMEKDMEASRQKLLEVCSLLGLNGKTDDINYVLRDFHDFR